MASEQIAFTVVVRNYTTRAAVRRELLRLIEPISTTGLRLLVRHLPVHVALAAHEYCALIGASRSLKRALIKHNISVPYELQQLIEERAREEFRNESTKEAETSGEANHGDTTENH